MTGCEDNSWTEVSLLMPEAGVPVRCQLQSCSSGNICEYVLVHVTEDDCVWRTADDFSEVSYDFDVIAWKPV